MPIERRILDYAPPATGFDRALNYLRKHRILWFLILRPLRATEVVFVGWPMICTLNLLYAANGYFFKAGYNLDWIHTFIGTFAAPVVLVTFAAIARLLLCRRWKMGLSVLILTIALAMISGLVLPQPCADDKWLYVFDFRPSLQRFPYRPDRYIEPPGEVIWWLDYVPYWRYF